MLLRQVFRKNIVSSVLKQRFSCVLPSVNARFMCASSETPPNKVEEKSGGESILPERETLIAENKSLLDKYRRVLAETENIRKSSLEALEEIKATGIENFSHDLAKVADKFNRALMSVNDEEKKLSADLNKLYKAAQMIRDSMLKSFAKHGLSSYEVELGQMFDSKQHEKIYEMASYHEEPGKILHQVRTGYKLNDKIIRLPGVGVAVLHKNESSEVS